MSRGLWPFATIFFLATTLLFAYLAFHYSTQAEQTGDSAAETAVEPNRENVPPPPVPAPSAWETQNKAAPMANVPVYDLGLPGATEILEFPEIELKTTVQWILLLYRTPAGQEIRRPEILLYGPGDRIYWGAGPLPTISEGKLNTLVIPGDFLPQGGYRLMLRGTDGEKYFYPFRLVRKRHPWEEEQEEKLGEEQEEEGQGE